MSATSTGAGAGAGARPAAGRSGAPGGQNQQQQQRRQKGMSIGNAASLFGAPSPSEDDSAAFLAESPAGPDDFFGSLGPSSSSGPAKSASAKSTIASIGEENEVEETAQGEGMDAEESTANLFGGDTPAGGASDPATSSWLGGAGYDQTQQQQPYSDHSYDWSQQQQQQAHSQDGNAYSQYASYDQAQEQPPQGTASSSSMYYDPSAPEQYQANLQSQAHHSGYDCYGNSNGGASYASQGNYGNQAAGSLGYEQNAYYPQQAQQDPYYAQQQGPQSANQYGYPQTQQQQQQQQQYGSPSVAPYSAPAYSANVDPMQRSQSRSSNSGAHYAPSYSQAYDPYAPTSANTYSGPAGSANYSSLQGASKHPTLTHSATMASVPHSSSLSATGSQSSEKTPRPINRSASSFFAELPALPQPKSRPASSLGQGVRGHQAAPSPLTGMQQARQTPPPPPKSRTPAPGPPPSQANYAPQRPSSVASTSSQMAYSNPQQYSQQPPRPYSRSQSRQSNTSAAQSARSSFDQAAHSGPQTAYQNGFSTRQGNWNQQAGSAHPTYGSPATQHEPSQSQITSPPFNAQPFSGGAIQTRPQQSQQAQNSPHTLPQQLPSRPASRTQPTAATAPAPVGALPNARQAQPKTQAPRPPPTNVGANQKQNVPPVSGTTPAGVSLTRQADPLPKTAEPSRPANDHVPSANRGEIRPSTKASSNGHAVPSEPPQPRSQHIPPKVQEQDPPSGPGSLSSSTAPQKQLKVADTSSKTAPKALPASTSAAAKTPSASAPRKLSQESKPTPKADAEVAQPIQSASSKTPAAFTSQPAAKAGPPPPEAAPVIPSVAIPPDTFMQVPRGSSVDTEGGDDPVSPAGSVSWDFGDEDIAAVVAEEAVAEVPSETPANAVQASVDELTSVFNKQTLEETSTQASAPEVKMEVEEQDLHSDPAPPLPSVRISAPTPQPPHEEFVVKKEEEDDDDAAGLMDEDEAEAAWELDQAEAELEREIFATELAPESGPEPSAPGGVSGQAAVTPYGDPYAEPATFTSTSVDVPSQDSADVHDEGMAEDEVEPVQPKIEEAEHADFGIADRQDVHDPQTHEPDHQHGNAIPSGDQDQHSVEVVADSIQNQQSDYAADNDRQDYGDEQIDGGQTWDMGPSDGGDEGALPWNHRDEDQTVSMSAQEEPQPREDNPADEVVQHSSENQGHDAYAEGQGPNDWQADQYQQPYGQQEQGQAQPYESYQQQQRQYDTQSYSAQPSYGNAPDYQPQYEPSPYGNSTYDPYETDEPPQSIGYASQGQDHAHYSQYEPQTGQQPSQHATNQGDYPAYSAAGEYNYEHAGQASNYRSQSQYSQSATQYDQGNLVDHIYTPYAPQFPGDHTASHLPSQTSSYEAQQQPPPPLEPTSYDPYAVSTTRNESYQSETQYGIQTSAAPNVDRNHRPPIPVVSFGFDGKLLTWFPSSTYASKGASGGGYGTPYESQDIASTKSSVTISSLSQLLSTDQAALASFPGPLFMDAGSTSASGKAKKKKEILAWLDTKIGESEKGRSHGAHPSSMDARTRDAEDNAVLLKLVRLLLENDGRLIGSATIDESVRQILVPHLPDESSSGFTRLSTAAELHTASSVPATSGSPAASASSADMDALHSMLLRSNKRDAVRYALDHRLWGHALIIASAVDEELKSSVVREFLQAELPDSSGNRKALKVAYSLFAGVGPSSIQHFVPERSLQQQRPMPSTSTLAVQNPYAPETRNPSPVPSLGQEFPADIPVESLAQWRETAAMIVANRPASDSTTLTALGDALVANGWLKAGHVCYLLSPQTSALGGPMMPGVRYSLIGSQHSLQLPSATTEVDAIELTEIVEFALSLVPVPKGQEAYAGLPHLQAYRLVHALRLSDLGLHAQAQRYCDAIGSTMKLATKPSPFYHPALLAQVTQFSDRLSNVSFQDKGSWLSRKVQRPTLDNVWSTLEGRFTKFVAGEAEVDPQEALRKKQAEDAAKAVAGPFAHYSSITPHGPESISRNPSPSVNMRYTPPPQPQVQSTSVPNSVTKPGTKTATHHRRTSSYGFGPYGADPYPPYVPQMPDIPAEETSEQQMSQQQQQGGYQDQYQYGYGSNYPSYGYTTPGGNESGWWGAANGSNNASPYTPGGDNSNSGSSYAYGGGGGGQASGQGRSPALSPVAENSYSNEEEGSGLLSPMDFAASSNNHTMMSRNASHDGSQGGSQPIKARSYDEIEEDDELGLGNMSNKKKRNQKQEQDQQKENGSASARAASEPPSSGSKGDSDSGKKGDDKTVKPAASSSWLGRIFKRDGGSPSGPIRAKLGEETSFVYDPVEKRWVNKKAGAETPPPAPMAPPPRAQTASPTVQSRGHPSSGTTSSSAGGGGPPPPPASRSVNSTPPPPAQALSRNSTPPPPSASGAASGTTSSPLAQSSSKLGDLPPPLKRPATTTGAGSRKNVRSRYVDVFAQQQQQ